MLKDFLLWMFPVIFILHDFEEIIFISQFKANNKELYKHGEIPFYKDFISTESFSIAVFIEFILFSAVTAFSQLTGLLLPWIACFGAFILHFIAHIGASIKIKKNIPGAISSAILFIPAVPVLGYIILNSSLTVLQICIALLSGVIVLFGLIRVLHCLMPVFARIAHSSIAKTIQQPLE